MDREQILIREWTKLFGQPTPLVPEWPSQETLDLRERLIREEFEELLTAFKVGDIVAVADALADLNYVIKGTAVSFGIDMQPVFYEVHRSNMTKIGAELIDGKVQKPEGYIPPHITSIIKAQMPSQQENLPAP